MKSRFSYEFDMESSLSLRNLQSIDLSCADFQVIGSPINQLSMMECLKHFNTVKTKYSTSNMKKLSLNLDT